MPDQRKYIIWAFMIFIGLLLCFYLGKIFFYKKNQGDNDIANIQVIDNEDKMNKEITDGKILFLNNCASCHIISRISEGPRLDNIEERWPDKNLLYEFIRDSEKVIKENEYARELWLTYGKRYCMKFPNMKDEEIDAIFRYIKKWKSGIE